MTALILIGFKSEAPNVPVNLYTGTNGVDLQAAADEAAETGEYNYIGLVVNPFSTPMPTVAQPTVHTKPVFHSPKLQKAEAKSKAKEEPKLPEETKPQGDGGPTFEEFVAAGYDPANYPPEGYTAKESPGWTLYQQNKTSAQNSEQPKQGDAKAAAKPAPPKRK